ncbi:hypothetical protein AB0B45_17940 [Nonomuraea sp. NPDC049152]|uniref:hypothetical protein n=1 Tax=Nonomuraea sp. NPDC049152 TaxID=3154350 RepID=UPI0034099326
MRQYSGNRIGLGVVGAVLLGVGGYAYLRGAGALGKGRNARVLEADLTGYVAAHPWIAWGLALVLVLIAMLTTRWLFMALGWGRLGSRSGTGTALLCVGLKDVDGISRTSVRVVGEDRLRLAVTCPSVADVGAVVTKLNRELVSRVRRDIGDDDMGAIVRVHVRR